MTDVYAETSFTEPAATATIPPEDEETEAREDDEEEEKKEEEDGTYQLKPDGVIKDIIHKGKVERSISTSCWVQNLVGDSAAGKRREAHVSFFPLQTTVTYDTENITPDEAVVFFKDRTTDKDKDDTGDKAVSKACFNTDTRAVTNIRSAAEVVNHLATTSYLQYTMYSSRNLVPLFMSNSRQGEFGGRSIRLSSIRNCFSRESVVDGLLKDMRKRKVNAAKAFIKAVHEGSAVNTALAAWNAGNAANLEQLVVFCRNKYGPNRKYNAAGIHRKTQNAPKTLTSKEFLDEIVQRHKKSSLLTFDSAPTVFNEALSRVFREFRAAVESRDASSPLLAAVRQNCRGAENECIPDLGMMAPRKRHSVAEYMQADKNLRSENFNKKVKTYICKISTDIENVRKRKADIPTEDLKDTLAASVFDSAVDVTAADTLGENYEWSLHITQLFAQAFLETMGSLLSCVFNAPRPFTNEWFGEIRDTISKRTQEQQRTVDMDPTVLADQYLLLTGNFQIPFHVSEHDDVVCGRQVVPNTPLLTLVTRFLTSDDHVVTEIETRDRLLVGDVKLDTSANNVSTTSADQRNKPSDHGKDKKPMMQGCLPVIRGPIAFDRNYKANSEVDDTINCLANDWYVSLGSYYAMGKSTTAIVVGHLRAQASAEFPLTNEKSLKRSMRKNIDRTMHTLKLLGQSVSEWGHSEHNSTLDTFWSSSAAVRSKATQDALSRTKLLSMRRQMDGKCDEFFVAEQHLRDSFFRAVSRTTGTGGDEIILLPDSMSRYKDVFADDSSSGPVPWERYVTEMSHLNKYENSAFNIEGLFSAINGFRFPLVTEGKHTGKHRKHNLRAARAIFNGLTEMTLQTAVNGTSIDELNFGSAEDGWGGCIQPSRMHALKAMSKTGANPNVISIPVSRSLSGRGDITSIDIPVVIVSHLISDKRTLDGLCEANNTNLCAEISKFLVNLTGANSQAKSSIFTVGKYSIILLRYIWFNTAVISLTDVNIKTALDFLGRELGSSLYCDFLAIRRLVNKYNTGLTDFSVRTVADRYNCETRRVTGNVTIKNDRELNDTLTQISNALSAFTATEDGTPHTNTITLVNDTETVKNAKVIVDFDTNQVKTFKEFTKFLCSIYEFNSKTEEPLRRYALGKDIPKSDIEESTSHPDITAIFKRKLLDICGTVALDTPINQKQTVEIDLNEFPLIVKAAATDKVDVGNITTPENITAAAAINIVNAFTRYGGYSNRNTHLNILARALESMDKHMESDGKTITMSVDTVSTFVRDGLLSCLIVVHSTAAQYLLNPLIRDIAKLLRDLVAETSLVVSRLQKAFFPIHPATLSLGDLFKPDREAFDDMTREYVSEIVKQMTDATTRDISEPATSIRMFKAGEIYSRRFSHQDPQATSSQAPSSDASNFQNPAKVWSVSALPHFDVAAVPRFHSNVTFDQLFRLSTYHQGMHKLSLNADCTPGKWDSSLAGNRARDLFGLRTVSDNNRSFNLALDTVFASPAELCDLVSREMVRASNDVVHNIGSASNVDMVNKLLDMGASAIEKLSASAPSTEESRIRDTVLSLTKSGASTNEGLLTAKEIVKSWNTPSLLNMKSLSSDRDVVEVPLKAIPSFRQNFIEASRSLYELAAVCLVMSNDDTARTSSLKIMHTFEETSPVMFDIGVSRIAGLVSTVTSNKQQKRLLQIVSDYRNSLIRRVVNPLSATPAASSALSSGLKAVYDGMISSSAMQTPSSSQTVSPPDQFWMGVFSECLGPRGTPYAEQRRTSPSAKLYGSRINTYAALSTDRAVTSVDKERRKKIEQTVANIEKYVSGVLEDGTMENMVNAQKTYNKLADITANSVHADFHDTNCHSILRETASKTKTARQQSDTILAAMLHELASMVYNTERELGSQLSLAGHILTAKGVCRELINTQTRDIFNNLLSVAGVSDFCHVSANTLCSRLKPSDTKLFLGGTLLQQGLFLSFLLNNVLFYQISEDLKMANLKDDTKSLLVKLVDFCKTVDDALSTRHLSTSCIHRLQRAGANTEETKLDVSFIASLFSAYRNLRRESERCRDNETVAQIFGRLSDYSSASASDVRGPRRKRDSTLEDVLQAPSTIHKTLLVSYPEKAAATRQVKRAGGAVLSNSGMEVVYGPDMLNGMRDTSDYFMQNICDDDIDMLDENYEDEFGESYLYSSSSDTSDYSNSGDDDDDDDDNHYYYCSQRRTWVPKSNKGGGTYTYNALDHLGASHFTRIYRSRDYDDDDDDDDEDERSHRGNTQLDSILKTIGESDDEFDEDDETFARHRSERSQQYGVGFLSNSFIMKHPAKARAFFTRGKRFKREPESTSSSSDESGSSPLHRSRRAKIYHKRNRENQFLFIRKLMRQFQPTRITLLDGEVSMVAPASSDTAPGFLEEYLKANKSERDKLREHHKIDNTETSLQRDFNPRLFRRSLIKTAAYVLETQNKNAGTFYQAIITKPKPIVPDPAAILSETVLFSKDFQGVKNKRDEFLKDLTEVSSSLFTSSGTSMGRDEEILRKALDSVSVGDENRPGYLGVPLRNLSRCIKTTNGGTANTLTVDQLLAVTDKNHLDWMTMAAISFTRSFNVTTFHALDSTLKTTTSLNDMYKAFSDLLSSRQEERIKVNSTLLDSIFNTRMAHLEAVMGLVYPTVFINHRMPHDPEQRRNLQALSLNILRGVNSNQLPRHDIGDTSGLLTFITSPKFAGKGGERGGLSLYRMSITDALSCEPADRRLRGAVTLEVGKWSNVEDSVFSKRSADLVDFCSKNNLTLENAVGPIARFIPDGTDPTEVGMESPPPLYVKNDTAALRLQSAEEGCGAAGRFITASATGNLFGKIEDITTLANKVAGFYAMLDLEDNDKPKTLEDMIKKVMQNIKTRRKEALKTPFGDTVTARAADLPSLSDSIVLRAREMRQMIATIVIDMSKKCGIFGGSSRTTNSVIPTRVSVSTFKLVLETSEVLGKTKMFLRGIENRLAAAYTVLRQFQHIMNDGLSGSKAVFVAIAKSLGTLSYDDNEDDKSATLLRVLVEIELKNIQDAKKQVTAAIDGTCNLHAKMLSVLTASTDFNSKSIENQRLSDKMKGGNFEPMTNTRCGTIIKHKGTGVWLKTDEECNTKYISTGGAGGAMNDHGRRAVQNMMSIVENNHDCAIRSSLQSTYLGRFFVNDIFVLDDLDAKSVDELTERLCEALAAEKASSPSSSSSSTAPSLVSASTVSEGVETPSAPKTECLGKTIPYIPIIFENKQKDIIKSAREHDTDPDASTSATEQKAAAIRQLNIQDSNDVRNLLTVCSNHKFATHNQYAIVNIFNGRQSAELVIPENPEYEETNKGILSRLPASVSIATTQANISSGSNVQLPPDSMKCSSSSVPERLKECATKLAPTLHNAPEYKDLNEAQRKITVAIKHAVGVKNGSFFTGGACPEINQTVMTTLSHSQSAKEGALELLEKVLASLETYVPDPSLASVSVPINSSSLSDSRGLAGGSSSNNTDDYLYATFEKLNSVSLSEDGTDAIINNAVEQDATIRVPLLLSSPGFVSALRALVESMNDYYKHVDEIRVQISSDAKHAVAVAVRATDFEIGEDKKSMILTIDNLRDVYSNEADNINTAIKVLENKNSELELQNNRTASIINDITKRIETGDNTANAIDMLDYGNKADNDQQFLQNLKNFAKENSGPAYTPPAFRDTANASTNNNGNAAVRNSYKNLMRDAFNCIKQGQEGVTVDFGPAIDAFPAASTQYDTLTMQTAEQKQRDRYTSVELYRGIIADRINKLHDRLAHSAKESGEVDAKKMKINSVFRRQVENRHDDIRKNVNISETAAASALSKDIVRSPLMISLNGKVDKLLMRSERLGGTLSSSNPSNSSKAPKSDIKSRVEHIIVDSSTNSCYLHPLHDSIRRISSMYSIRKRGPLANGRGVSTSEADLQLMTIFDLSRGVLRSTSVEGGGAKNPELVPSSIVPGLCQQCAMMVTNLHEASHESPHAFSFESERSRQKLLDMLRAVTSESDDARIRSNVLAMLDSNNGHIKEFRFTQRQKVACLTPVNTLFGETFKGDVAPNTVILPTSELFSCPGVENDKFRSMAHRPIDKTVADAPKQAASIVETLARTSPNAENLFFPFKDERRQFNSIADAIISGMNSEASSQLNTACDQNLVQVDEATGFPVFVGRRGEKTRITETDVTAAYASHSGGDLSVCTKGGQENVNTGATFTVAPGSLLNANKEETLRLSRLSDINNVMHYETDVHAAGANLAWRMNEVIRAAASSCTDQETTIRQMLLLGSVSAVSAQKLAHNINDPTVMLSTSSAVQKLVNEAFPSPSTLVNHAEAAESAFSTQLAYRQRLFPHMTNNNGAFLVERNARPLDILSCIGRYSDAYSSLYSRPASNVVVDNNNKRFLHPCDILKQSVTNVPLSNTVYGAFEEASSAVNNRLSIPNLLRSTNDDSTNNKLAVQAITDTTIDTLSAMSSMIGRQSPYKLPSSVLKEKNGHDLLDTIARISKDASHLYNLGNGSAGLFSSFLRSSSSPSQASSSSSSSDISNAAERVLSSILNSAEETNKRLTRLGIHGPWGAGRPEAQALHRNAMTSILQMNEDEIARDVNDIESRIETRQLREAFQELKRSMLISSSTNSSSAPMSLLMPRSYAASGMVSRGLSTSALAMNTVDDFNTTPLLVRYILLDSGKSPLSLAKEVKNILTQPKAKIARALLSESSQLLSKLCLYNTRDTPPERAIDRLAIIPYLVKQAKRLEGVDPIFPAALTCSSHLMLSSMDSTHNSSSFLNNIKLHMNDTTSFLKNIERYELFLGRYGDAHTMSHRQNCNCPFTLHHTFTPSDDEHLIPSFAFARPEITTEEIRATPYQANKLLNDKHYLMNISKIDTRVTGSALLKKISEWTEMRMNVSFDGAFEPSRLALSNSGMTTAGVNLNVIVRPNNAKNVLGILECIRKHVCSLDAKCTIAAAMPAIFQATDAESGGNASDLVQNALPHNRFIQKSTMNASTIIFTNVLEQLITDLGEVIVNELAGELASSVPKTVYDNTQDMINRLGTDSLFATGSSSAMAVDESTFEGSGYSTNPRLVSDAMKSAIYHTLISGKTADPENVPFASTAAGPLAYDFLLSKDETVAETNREEAAARAVSSTASSVLRKHLARVFEAISKQVSDSEFGNILDDIEAKIFEESHPQRPPSDKFTFAIRQEFNKIISFLKILKNNITPALLNPDGVLAEKMAIYLSLLSAKSKLENFFQYGLSNSSSVDLSHLKPVNCSNGIKNIEDTFMYRNVHPVLIMALPENFTALLQQEQNDPEHAIENRRALTTFLGHPNTASMATGGRFVVGAGGGNPVGLYVSSHILHESTVATANPVLDEHANLSFHSPVTQDPVMVVNPFKDSARLAVSSSSEASSILNGNACSYLQVSMPTEFSGLVTNTGYAAASVSSKDEKFRYNRRDNTPVYLPKVTPAVLCSDASTNLLDIFSRANVVLEDMYVRFGFMPEIITAVAKTMGKNKAQAIKDMVAKSAINNSSSNKNTFVDAKTGDIIIQKGIFPDTRILHEAEKAKWGEDGTQKLHARALPVFLLNNPLATAAVNGIPLTLDGLNLVEEKRRKAAGIVSSSSEAGGCIGTGGALRAAANSRLVSDLKSLREGWENIIKLQNSFSKAASELKKRIEQGHPVPSETSHVVGNLYNNFTAITECREILQNQAAILMATNDLVTGGYAGDPSVAMIAPVHPETTGIVGAISSPIKGLSHLLKRDGVAAVTASIRQNLNLTTSNGRTLPEHGVVHKSAQELLTDADSIQNMYDISSKTTGASSVEEENLGKIMASLGLKRAKTGDAVYATKYISNHLASPEYGNRHDLTKRLSILQLLVANPDLLNNVSNALFMNNDKTSISPMTTTDTVCGILGTQNNSSDAVHNNVQTLNRLFGSRLS